MDVTILVLLFLAQFSRTFAHGVEIQSKICGSDHLVLSKFQNDKLFYINGNLVTKDLFCKALLFNNANDCFPEIGLECSCSELNLSPDSFLLKQARKLLQKEVPKQPESQGFDQHVPPEKKNDGSKTLSPDHKIGIYASGIVALGCAFLCPCFFKKRKGTADSVLVKDINSTDSISPFDVNSAPEKVPPAPFRVPPSPLRVPPSPSRFTQSPKLNRLRSVHLNISQVMKATQKFSQAFQIGEGGFGTVYKAILEDGQVVAIKRAKREVYDSLRTEFSSEVELLSKIEHRNLVKLLGYVDQGNERLIITEYVPNGTLRDHLDGLRGKILDFNQRLEISIDIAHALTYLHLYAEKQIIHRDVKSSNILLTDTMRAKVADFGFAKLGPVDADQTHVSTKVKGTVGYLDPEYMKTYQLTPKSDVYSFGILLIEIITGRRPVEQKRPADERVTLRWAFRKYSEGIVSDTLDPLMEGAVDSGVISKIFALAIHCAAPIRSDRPDMKSVTEQLWAIRSDSLRSSKGK